MKHTTKPQPQRIALAAISAALLVTAACSSNPEPRAIDTPDDRPRATSTATSTPTATPTPTPTPTTPTPTATQDIEAQLYEATVAFYNALATAYKSLDPKPIRDLSTSACAACDRYIRSIEDMKEEGHSFRAFGEYIIEDFKVDPDTVSSGMPVVTFTATHTGAIEVDRNGNVVEEYQRRSVSGLIVFERRGDRWAVYYQDVR